MRKNTDAKIRGGATGSSVEASVTEVERSGGVIRPVMPVNSATRMSIVTSAKPFDIAKREVWEAYQHVKANRGAAGIDDQSIEMFEAGLSRNLYKIWNRMSSGSYFPPAVKQVEIPKKKGGKRCLGVPTVADRIAQTVVKRKIEADLEQLFHPDSYGYRPRRSALQAVAKTRDRCWEYHWVVEFDIKAAFDNLDHGLLMRAVRKHVKGDMELLYIERWLKAPAVVKDGSAVLRDKGTPQGGVISPVLMNLFMHYAFDHWMQENYRHCPFARYADDAIVHCRSEALALFMLREIKDRFGQCGLELHPEKSKVVYCRSSSRRQRYPHDQFTFLGFTFRPRPAKDRQGKRFCGFLPAVSTEALRRMRCTVRDWNVPRQTPATLEELASKYNPILRGWWNYYGRYFPSAMRQLFRYFDTTLARWVRRKYRTYARHKLRSFGWVAKMAQVQPRLFVHWHTLGRSMVG